MSIYITHTLMHWRLWSRKEGCRRRRGGAWKRVRSCSLRLHARSVCRAPALSLSRITRLMMECDFDMYTHLKPHKDVHTHTLTRIIKPPMRHDWYICVIWLAETQLGKRKREEDACVCDAGKMDSRHRTSKCECALPQGWKMKRTSSGYVQLCVLQCFAVCWTAEGSQAD